jgi:hypothetical protein
MATAPLNIAVPTSRLVNPETGEIEVPWRQFLVALWQRTGGGEGQDMGGVVTNLADETAARKAADTANATAISNEQARAEGAEAKLVPVSQLAQLFSVQNLGWMQTSDPGGGRPWLKAGGLHVGP